jgi:hypothetical protein
MAWTPSSATPGRLLKKASVLVSIKHLAFFLLRWKDSQGTWDAKVWRHYER